MNKFALIIGLLTCAGTLAPISTYAQDAESGTRRTRATSHKRSQRTTVRKESSAQRPELPTTAVSQPSGSIAPVAETSPEAHAERFREFMTKLEKQVKENDLDACEAMAVMLMATSDELALSSWMEKAAAEGNPVGMHYLGMTSAAKNTSPEIRYLSGQQRQALLSQQQSAAKAAAAWLKKAADKKYVPAMLDYSVFLRNGIGVLKNEPAANRLLLEASKTGNFDTRFSWLLQNGRLTKWADKDRPEVAGEIKRGNHHVIYYLSQFAPESRTQLEWLHKAVAKGNGAAMYALSAVMVNHDPAQSLKLLKSAVVMHDPAAMYVYGSFLVAEPGEFHAKTGLQPNVALGVSMLRLSCMLGNSQSRRALARAYYRGEFGLPKDRSRTYAHLHWLNSAQRDPIAFAAQGFMLLTGDGVAQDIDTGLRYITLAANANYSYAAAMLAYAHYKGLGKPKDPAMAIEVLQEAAAAGFPHAYLYIAFLTAKGLHGQPADARGAERYINLASLNLGTKAREFFDQLMKQDDWELTPFALENS